ncbi:sensor histidine kinase [Frondihabitans australicus]|uniref:histidine kinase n=1 Tax=Frondihabitans australicus TaxID=386892 RepID=A0A495IGP8_9MICO|nr:histidine kinase [Frondihabitans australicus]RKR74256.1 signal transduction histidine kinase [Frondihabitans australicus]
MWNSLERRPMVVDVLVGVVALLFFAALDVTRTGWETLPVDALFAFALVFRRRSPGLALAVAWVGAITQLVILPSFINGNVMVAAVIFATSLADEPAVRRLGLASSILGGVVGSAKLVLITGLFLPPEASHGQEAVSRVLYFTGVAGVIAASLALFWLLGAVTRVRRAFIDERLERSEREQELLRAELRVAQETERTRITREMHDAIGHSLAVIIAQSDGARYAVAKNPAAATEALGVINRSARDALDDVSELLSVLKGTGEHHGTLGVADLDRMLDSMRSSGLELRFSETGTRFALSTAEDLALYRVVQEALTNALKHGGPGTVVDLRLDWGAAEVVVDSRTTESEGAGLVDDSPAHHGHGVAGMNERVRLVGGRVTAGPRTDGERGYVVNARIPRAPGGHE